MSRVWERKLDCRPFWCGSSKLLKILTLVSRPCLLLGQSDPANEPIYHQDQRARGFAIGPSICCWWKLLGWLRSCGELGDNQANSRRDRGESRRGQNYRGQDQRSPRAVQTSCCTIIIVVLHIEWSQQNQSDLPVFSQGQLTFVQEFDGRLCCLYIFKTLNSDRSKIFKSLFLFPFVRHSMWCFKRLSTKLNLQKKWNSE